MKNWFNFFKKHLFNAGLATVLAVAFLVTGIALAQSVPWTSPAQNPPLGNPAGFILSKGSSESAQEANIKIGGTQGTAEVRVLNVTGGPSSFVGDVTLLGSSNLILNIGQICFGGSTAPENCFDPSTGLGGGFLNHNESQQLVYTDVDNSGGDTGSDFGAFTQAHVVMTAGDEIPGDESKVQAFNRGDWIEIRNDSNPATGRSSTSSVRWGRHGNISADNVDIFQIQNFNPAVSASSLGDSVNAVLTINPFIVNASGSALEPNSGFVGIGADDPDAKLHIYDDFITSIAPTRTIQTGYGSFADVPYRDVIKAQVDVDNGSSFMDISAGFTDQSGYVRLNQELPLSLEAGSASLALAPDSQDVYAYWKSGHDTVSGFSLYSSVGDLVGSLYGTDVVFGLTDKDDDWILRSSIGDPANPADDAVNVYVDGVKKANFTPTGITLTNEPGGGIVNDTQNIRSVAGDLLLTATYAGTDPFTPADVRVHLNQIGESFKVQSGDTGSEIDIMRITDFGGLFGPIVEIGEDFASTEFGHDPLVSIFNNETDSVWDQGLYVSNAGSGWAIHADGITNNANGDSHGIRASGNTQALWAEGPSLLDGNVTATNNLDVTNNLNVDNNLDVDGTSRLRGRTQIDWNTFINGNLNIAASNSGAGSGILSIDSPAPIIRLRETGFNTDWWLVADNQTFSIRINNQGGGNYPFQVNRVGDLSMSGSIQAQEFFYSSDERLKKDIKPISDELINSIFKLDGVSYKWRKDGEADFGLIAQAVESIYPELVKTNSDGYKFVDYGSLVVPLIEITKKQQEEIDSLEDRIQRLERLLQ